MLSLEAAVQAAAEVGVCAHPLPFRIHDRVSGETRLVQVACGALIAAKCPSCARAAQLVRAAQCREGWHLESEPGRQAAGEEGTDGGGSAALSEGPEGRPQGSRPAESPALRSTDDQPKQRVQRSTRRRQDAASLPTGRRRAGTLGKTFTGGNGQVYRPSMFLTLTLPSYGRVRDGAPVAPGTYDYLGAARDALHFARLVDRFVQNLRRVAGYPVQYFAVVEPQRRLAPHLHMAIRGTLPRRDMRQIVAATYHQVWWPVSSGNVLEGTRHPVWVEGAGYIDPETGEVLPTWDEALARMTEPRHVVRWGSQMRMRGVLVGSEDADRAVRYLAKYLTKSMHEALLTRWGELSEAERAHTRRLIETVRYEPCSPECSNWLRAGVQPKGARPGMVAGLCHRRAHRAERLGYGGRRSLVSRSWSGRRVSDYRAERRAWVLAALGREEEATEDGRLLWEPVRDGDEGVPSRALRIWHLVAERRAAHEAMKQREDAGRREERTNRDALEQGRAEGSA
ncbi:MULTISPECIES: replication initiator [unclassified Nonomuraea]|uniref:replication initiator n=1 Tax=unclassified Nonomuraea TaxID=2593643 RepID=UPI0033C015A9